MANRTVDILRVMFKWAISRGHLKRNPCLGVQGLKDTNAGTNYVWTPADMLRFEAFYGPGTRERLAYSLLLYSGQRSGDVVRMGRQHIKKDDRGIPWLVTQRQRKTSKGAKVPVVGVLTEAIADADAAGVTGDLTFLVGDDGLTMTEFSCWFKRACKKAGVPECGAHGLRHAGATRLASRGARPSTLIQIYGFTLTQADTYIRDAEMEQTTLEDIHLLNHVA
jgi:integrase